MFLYRFVFFERTRPAASIASFTALLAIIELGRTNISDSPVGCCSVISRPSYCLLLPIHVAWYLGPPFGPSRAVNDGVYHHTPLGPIFHARHLHSSSNWNTNNTVGAKNVGVGTISPSALEDVSFGNATLLVVEQSSLESRPSGV